MPMVRERPSLAPRQFIEITPALRRALEALVEAGIAALDEIDAPTEDLEEDDEPEDDGADEPTLGWPEDPVSQIVNCPHPRRRHEERDGELEPSLGWTSKEASSRAYTRFPDEAEEDDPPEDDNTDEPEESDANLTAPDTASGFRRAFRDDADELRVRERMDPRLARRPTSQPPGAWCGPASPVFPHEPADRPPFNQAAEKRRLNNALARRRSGSGTKL